MLTQFSFCNFKSYRNKATLEMQAEKDNDFKDSLLDIDNYKEKFLPVSVIYGPNGGGKTNVLEALISLITHIIAPIRVLRNNKNDTYKIDAIPFEFCNHTNNIVEFEIFYIVSDYEYKYTLRLEDENIIFESLYRTALSAKKPEKIFLRNKNEIELGIILSKNKVNIAVNEQMPYLSFIAISYDIDVINEAISFFRNANFINIDVSRRIPAELIELDEYKKIFLDLLKAVDSCIVDFNIEKNENTDLYTIYTIHEVKGKRFSLPLGKESKGTIKMFSILPAILDSIIKGGICIIDELDSKLHPKLLRFIIELFKEPGLNKNNAQLIFTSHDLVTMSNDVFRRDEILFAAKNENQESELYSLYEIRDEEGKSVNKNSSYSKQYLEGRYGSDPYFQKIHSF
jgi:hypothetical protein